MKTYLLKNSVLFIATLTLAAACGGSKSSKDGRPPLPGQAGTTNPNGNQLTPKISTQMNTPLNTQELPSGIGFYDLNSGKIPGAISKAALSVFKVYIMGSNEKSLITVDVTDKDQRAQIQRAIKKTAEQDQDPELAQMLQLQVDNCLRSSYKGSPKSCTLTSDLRRSTGTLVGQADEMWINAHALEGFFEAAEKFQNTSRQDVVKTRRGVVMFIYDAAGKLIFNPYKGADITVQQMPKQTALAQAENKYYAVDSDYLKLKLPRALGTPLRRAQAPAQAGDRVFLAGYPTCTNCQQDIEHTDSLDLVDRGEGLNSDGRGVKFTTGQMLSTAEAVRLLSLDRYYTDRAELSRMLFYTADSVQGLSGAPVLNTQGEVLGLHAGGKGLKQNNQLMRVSRGVQLP